MKKIILCLMLVFQQLYVAAQSTPFAAKDYARKPLWIEMIKDTAANYFEVEKAFNQYFKHHEKPEGENEEIGEHAARKKHVSKREQKKIQKENHMRMEIKKYEHWRMMMLPYVQPDGSILSPTQRIEMWKSRHQKK
jgi:alpha-galactosidase/6-phospho-beta-glucosidase family protein